MQLNPNDPAIVLFGKEIPLSSNGGGDDASSSDTSSVDKEDRDEELEEEIEKKRFSAEADEETMQQSSGIDASQNSVTLDVPFVDEEETAKPKSSKTVKKPEKIPPCPRCNSTDTKFCYYNNYNVNQPRHFCKSCQRYWTAGGMMRSMQVGAGRRKNKRSSSHYRHITFSEALQAAQIDAAGNTVPHPGFKYRDGIILKFGGVNSPIRDLTASILNGTNKKVLNGMMDRLHSPKSGKRPISNSNGENNDDCSSNSTVSTLSSNNGGTANKDFHPQIPSIPASPLPYPWNYPTILPQPTLSTPGFGMPFYPAAFLNCSFLSNFNLPSLVPSNSIPDSPTLEKRDRDVEVLDLQNPAKRRNPSILVPKTLRADNPNEAVKSTIWSTLGIKNDSLCREGFDCISPALVSNPAALLRSLNFIESTLT